MGLLPAGLSVHHFVSSVGADAGFAAIIGLAILILLYFAQARETSTLRDRAEELLEHVQALEARVAELATPERAAAPAPGQATAAGQEQVPAGTAAGAAGGIAPSPAASLAALELPPGPPAGVGAPALSAATRIVPAGVAARALPTRAPVPVGVAAPAAPPVGSALPAATAAGGSNGASHSRRTPPPPAIRRSAAPRPTGAPVRQTAGVGARRSVPPPPDPRGQRPRGRGRVILAVAVAAVVLAAVAVGVVLTLSSTSTTHAPATTSASTQRSSHRRPSTGSVRPSLVTVAVLNGTATSGLAHKTAQRLTGAGFRPGRISTAADQTRTASTVAYIPGARADALAVARSLGLGSSAVQPLDASTRAVAFACSPSPCAADVVLTVGADLASR